MTTLACSRRPCPGDAVIWRTMRLGRWFAAGGARVLAVGQRAALVFIHLCWVPIQLWVPLEELEVVR